MNITGGQAVVEFLKRNDITEVFGMAGHGNLALLDSFIDSHINFYSVPHEQIAVHAADAYFRIKNKISVVTTTVGPGSTNTVTALADALLDSSAVLLICGGIPSFYSGKDALQELGIHNDDEQFEIFKPVTKRIWKVNDISLLLNSLKRALHFAIHGNPGPVMVHVPLDYFSKKHNFNFQNINVDYKIQNNCSPSDIEKLITLINKAKKPAILAGNGVILSEGAEILTKLSNKINIPVITTMSGQGCIDETSANYFGFTGVVGTPSANQILKETDVLVVIGTKMPEMDCNSWSKDFFLNESTEIIHVDIDPYQFSKIINSRLQIQSNAKYLLESLYLKHEEINLDIDKRWLKKINNIKDKWKVSLSKSKDSYESPITVERLLSDINECRDDDTIIVSGVGLRHAIGQFMLFKNPRTNIVGSGFGTMGQEVPAAIGAKIAKPESTVIAIVGDGSFRSTMQTLVMAAEYNIPVIWIVQNNYSFNIISLYQNKHWGRKIGTDFKKNNNLYNPDFVSLAKSFGLNGYKVQNPKSLLKTIKMAISSKQPCVIDVISTMTPNIKASGYWAVNDIFSKKWDGNPF